MAKVGQKQIQFRKFKGINLNVDSRVEAPTAWKRLQNLYQKIPGKLQKRPGSVNLEYYWYLDWRMEEAGAVTGAIPILHMAGNEAKSIIFDMWDFGDDGRIGGEGGYADSYIGTLPENNVTEYVRRITSIGAVPVHGHDRDVIIGAASFGGRDKLWYLRHQANDDSKKGIHIMEWCPETFWGNGRDWFFTPAINMNSSSISYNAASGSRSGPVISKRAFGGTMYFNTPGQLITHTNKQDGAIVGYATDQLGILQVIYDQTKASWLGNAHEDIFTRAINGGYNSEGLPTPDTDNDPTIYWSPYGPSTDNTKGSVELKCVPAYFCGGTKEQDLDAEEASAAPGTDAELVWQHALNDGANPEMRIFVYMGVQSMCEFKNSLVIGGFARYRPFVDANEEGYLGGAFEGPNYIAFSESRNSHMFHPGAVIRIGANKQEPVTAMGRISSPSDSEGINSQLAIFTSRKVVVFNGLPPQGAVIENISGFGPTDESNQFAASLNFDVGTTAQRSVVETPYGLVFLGTDGVVYVLRGAEKPQPIGRAIQPILRGLAGESMRRAVGYFDKGFYKLIVPDIPAGNTEDMITQFNPPATTNSQMLSSSMFATNTVNIVSSTFFTGSSLGAFIPSSLEHIYLQGSASDSLGMGGMPPLVASAYAVAGTVDVPAAIPSPGQTLIDFFTENIFGSHIKPPSIALYQKPSSPVKQYWADLRYLTPGAYDEGAAWSGPHDGQSISDVVVAKGSSNRREVYAVDGGTNKIDILQLSLEDETTDYQHGHPLDGYTPGVDIAIKAISPDMDMQDAHIDKLYQGLELGVGVDKPTLVRTTVSALSPGGCSKSGDGHLETISPCGLTWSFELGAPHSQWSDPGDFELYCVGPANRLQGRVFSVTIEEDSDAKVTFSDLTVKLTAKNRRCTLINSS